MSSQGFHALPDQGGDYAARLQGRRANRRRLVVFLAVTMTLSIIGLVYDFSRPAIYEATARLDFVPAATPAADDPTRVAEKPYALRDEVQYLTSTTLLAKVWDGLKDSASTPPALQRGDPAATLQSMLSVTQVSGSHIVAVRAHGPDAAFLPQFIDRLVADYRTGLGERYRSGSGVAATEAADEAGKLEASVLEKRREVDAFRARYHIVSSERDENKVLSEVKGVGTSLNAANEKVVAAEARLGALTEAEASGRSVTRARDNPTLAALEQEAARIRADLQETSRTFTPEYMKIDPRIRSLQARLDDIGKQIVVQRQASQQGAIQEAREELASAKAAVAALRRQLATNQDSVQSFTSRFNEYRAMQDQLARLETLRQKAVDRVAVLRAEQQSRMPKVEVLEAASVPQSAASPQYLRDAGIAIGLAVVAGLLTMAIVELFNRPAKLPSTIVVPQTWAPAGLSGGTMALPPMQAYDALTLAPERPRLHAPQTLPRELTESELDALLATADPRTRAAIALLLMGLSAREVVALRRGDVRRETASIAVTGDDERVLAMPPRVMAWLPDETAPADAVVLGSPSGRPLTEADLATALLYAAHDAALAEADEVTPEALRHTYIAFLLRQGLRFADLARLVGTLPTERLAAYRQLTPPSSTGEVALVLPALEAA